MEITIKSDMDMQLEFLQRANEAIEHMYGHPGEKLIVEVYVPFYFELTDEIIAQIILDDVKVSFQEKHISYMIQGITRY